MSNEHDLHQIRAKAQEILERAKSDEEFRRQLQDDPTAVLPRYGLPERAVPDFIREAGKRVLCEEASTCFDYTCLVIFCPGSCI